MTIGMTLHKDKDRNRHRVLIDKRRGKEYTWQV